jgi:hypothetical protein
VLPKLLKDEMGLDAHEPALDPAAGRFAPHEVHGKSRARFRQKLAAAFMVSAF